MYTKSLLSDLRIKQKSKFMGPFKKMRNFFRGRKIRAKSKDDGVTGVGLRTKSANDMLDDSDVDSDEGYVLL